MDEFSLIEFAEFSLIFDVVEALIPDLSEPCP